MHELACERVLQKRAKNASKKHMGNAQAAEEVVMLSTLYARTLKKSRKLDTVDSRMDPDTRMVLASSCCSTGRWVFV